MVLLSSAPLAGRPGLSDGFVRRFGDAFAFVLDEHRDQCRKGSQVPYLSHLMQVAGLVMEHAPAADLEVCATAALLHDVVEDQDVSLAEVQERFGAVVARIVDGCTKPDTEEDQDWVARNVAYLRRLRDEDPRVVLVSLADKTHNGWAMVRDAERAAKMGDLDGFFSRFDAGAACQLWYYRALLRVYHERQPPKGLLRCFAEAVERLERVIVEDAVRWGVTLACPGEEAF